MIWTKMLPVLKDILPTYHALFGLYIHLLMLGLIVPCIKYYVFISQ